MKKCTKICCIAAAGFLLSTAACGQTFSIGVLGGVPLSSTDRSGQDGGRNEGIGPWYLDIRPYTVGPAFEVALPLRVYVEVDALYTRVDYEEHEFFSPLFGSITRQDANAWEFPMFLKYRWKSRFHPFASAGGTFRHIEGFEASQETFAYGLTPPYSVVRYQINAPLTEGGIAAAAGLTVWSLGRLKLVPELRYTHWTAIRSFPTQNQVEFLLGLKF
jgi:hypothetical protein